MTAPNLEKFALRKTEAGYVALVCFDCGEPIYGAPLDGLGEGEPEDNTLDRLVFVADEHVNLYCKGA